MHLSHTPMGQTTWALDANSRKKARGWSHIRILRHRYIPSLSYETNYISKSQKKRTKIQIKFLTLRKVGRMGLDHKDPFLPLRQELGLLKPLLEH